MALMPVVELPGVHLWYHDSGGNGIPVVFMHAASGTGDSWVYQLPAFTAAGYRCITYHRRGWGRSRPTPTGEQPGYVSDDLQGLAAHLRLDRFHLAATAAGGIGGGPGNERGAQRIQVSERLPVRAAAGGGDPGTVVGDGGQIDGRGRVPGRVRIDRRRNTES